MTDRKKIILVTDNNDVSDYMNLIVFKSLKAELTIMVNIQHALLEIQKGARADLIIVELPQAEGLQEFFDQVDGKQKVPVLFIADDNHIHLAGEYIPYHPLCAKVSYNLSELVIGGAIKRMLRISRRQEVEQVEEITPQVEEENLIYMELPIVLFMREQTISYDLYLKMSESKYVKVFKSGEALVKEDFEKYQKRSVKTVFLKSEDYVKATVTFSNQMSSALEVKNLRVEQYMALSLFSLDKVNKIINRLGLREEVLILTNQVLGLSTSMIEKNKDLLKLLNTSLNGKDFLSEHTMMLIFITSSIAKYMGWHSVTTSEKLTTAALFHDISLEDEELAKIEVIDSSTEKFFSQRQISKLRNHPQDSVSILDKFHGFPPDVDKIILQHHERPDGTGFPRGLDWKRIYSLAAVFIVAEDFVTAIYECGLNQINTEHILVEFKRKYAGKGNFTLAVEALHIALGYSEIKTLQAA
ncbi:MAG: putative nucleotidyltransferase with HDIG domain [Bacteriovoracaceae bacterium]|jgi:putative nucleotidyltransferase with HDIG domain